jgi:outer membrane protein TolC
VLDAQRQANLSEIAALRNRQALLSATVDLMKSLGGGWTPDQLSSNP